MADEVNHPDHYTHGKTECIDFTKHLSFNTGNAFKYLYRHKHKGNPKRDLEKAQWYLETEIARREDEFARDAMLKLEGPTAPILYNIYSSELGVLQLREALTRVKALLRTL